jgi:hypothetical protein
MFDTSTTLDCDTANEQATDAIASIVSNIGLQPTLTTVERLSRDVGKKIRTAEARLDSAGIAVAEVMIDYLRSEREARLHPSFGQAAVGKMIEALCSWHQFRALTVASHESLYEIAGKLGTQEIAGGDLNRSA